MAYVFFSIGINLVCLEWGEQLGFFGCFLDFMASIFPFPFFYLLQTDTFTESRIFRAWPKVSLFFLAGIRFLMGFSHYPLFVFSSHSAFGIGRAGNVFPSCMLYRRMAFVV